jgi:hypothetical protein
MLNMKTLAFAFVVLTALWIWACSEQELNASRINFELNYFKDNRTGLCFAADGMGEASWMTYVPCTPQVEALIQHTENPSMTSPVAH